jgi:hypothetical protein
VRATNKESITAADTVNPKGLKNCPTLPLVKATGKKTATIVRVEADTVKPISSLPFMEMAMMAA